MAPKNPSSEAGAPSKDKKPVADPQGAFCVERVRGFDKPEHLGRFASKEEAEAFADKHREQAGQPATYGVNVRKES
jgi:hypothetical protein